MLIPQLRHGALRPRAEGTRSGGCRPLRHGQAGGAGIGVFTTAGIWVFVYTAHGDVGDGAHPDAVGVQRGTPAQAVWMLREEAAERGIAR